jgi:putative membrane protein
LYLLYFGQHYVSALNYEFIAYAGLIVVIMALLYGTLSITRFPLYVVAGLSIWGLLHMMGGSVMTSDGVLYAWKMYPFFDGGSEFYILKFDQLVHAGLYGVVALMFLHLLREVLGIKTHVAFIAVVAMLASAGFSIINEIIEFAAVVALPETGVGGYYNTVLDLIFNFAGAAGAVVGYFLVKDNKEAYETGN